MKSYKDVKRRIMALLLAAVMMLSSITISTDARAESLEDDGIPSGGSIAQTFTVTDASVKLSNVTMNIRESKGQSITCTAMIYRKLKDGTYRAYNTSTTVSAAGEDTKKTITITPSDAICLAKGEEYCVVVTLTSDPSDWEIFYLQETGEGAYVKNPGSSSWTPQNSKIMNAATSASVADAVTGVTLEPAKVCVDKADVNNKSIAFHAGWNPAYQRTVTYSFPEDAPFDVNNTTGELSFDETVKCGSWEVTANVDGAEGPAKATVTIVEASLTGLPCTYSGEAKTPTVQVSDGANIINSANFDYKDSYENNIAAGINTASVTIKGKNDYEGYSHRIPFTIDPLTITQDNVTVTDDSFIIDTETDTVTNAKITVDGVELVYNSERRDFLVEAEKKDSKIVGGEVRYIYDITVTGQGNTTGEFKQENVTVVAGNSDSGMIDIRNLLKITVVDKGDYIYTGGEIIPEYTVTLAGSQLPLTDDEIREIVDVEGSIDASNKATVTFTGKNENNYTGTITEYFVIHPRSLRTDWIESESEFKLTVEQDPNTPDNVYIKTGKPINPEVTLQYNNKELTKGTDYEVTYEDCIGPGQMTINITGMGKNFTDTHPVIRTIVGDLKKDVIWSINGYKADEKTFLTGLRLPYNGTEQDVEVKGTIMGTPLTQGSDFSVRYTNKKNVGSAKAIITGLGNYDGQEVTLTYTIVKAQLANFGPLLITSDKTYTGKEITLTKDDYQVGSLNAGTDYELIYESDHTNAGTVNVTAKAMPDSNYEGTLPGEFTILPRKISDVDVTIGELYYNGRKQTPAVTLTYEGTEIDDGNYDVSVKEDVTFGEGTVTITGKENLTGTVEKPFQILATKLEHVEWSVGGADFTKSPTSGYSVEYTGSSKTPSVELRDGNTNLVEGEDYEVTYNKNKKAGTAEIKVTWKGGYATTDPITIYFEITPKNISAENANVTYEVTGNKDRDGDGNIFPIIAVYDKGRLLTETDYVLKASTKQGDEYNLKTSGATKKAIVEGRGNYTGELEVTYSIGKSLETEDYYVRMMDPHNTDTEVLPTQEDGITRFFYLGEGEANRPIAKLYYKNNTDSKDDDVDVTTYTDITYTSSLPGVSIYSAYTPSNPNIVTVSFEGKETSDYYGVVSAEYLIRPTAIGGENNAVIEAASTLGTFNNTGTVCEVPYTGSEIGLNEIKNDLKLTYKFKDGKTEDLENGTDYRLEIKTGSDLKALNYNQSVTVIAYGQGNYNSSKEFTYKIIKRDLRDCYVPETVNNKTINYTGKPILPYTEVYDSKNKRKLTPNVDYVVAFGDDTDIINSGTKEYKIVATENGNYTGELTTDRAGKKLQYTIKGTELIYSGTQKNVEIGNFIDSWEYKGEVTGENPYKQRSMTVTYTGGGKEISLVEGTDYDVTYNPEKPTEPGKYHLTITGKGAYEGTILMEYAVRKSMSAVTIKVTDKQYIVDTKGSITDSVNEGDIILTDTQTGSASKNLVEGTDYKIDYRNCKTPGECDLIFTGIGDYMGTQTKPIKVYRDLRKAEVKGVSDSYAYTGLPVGPESVVVKYGDDTVKPSDYSITKNFNIDVGVKTAILEVSPEVGAYYVNDQTIYYSIFYDLSSQYTQVTMDEEDGSYQYKKGGVKPEVMVTYDIGDGHPIPLTKDGDYTVTYSGNDKAGKAFVIINAKPGRSIHSKSVEFTIEPINIKTAANVKWKGGAEDLELEYNGKEQKPEVEVKTTNNETLTKGVDYDVFYENNKNVGKATVRIVGKGNCTDEIETDFRITPASLDPKVNAEISYTVEDTYYNNGVAKPEITVKFHNQNLTPGKDYDYKVVSREGNSEANPNVVMKPTDKDAYVEFTPHQVPGVTPNFADSHKEYFEIKAIDLNDRATVTLKNNTVEYTGKEIPKENLDITVECTMVGQTEPYELKKGTDYTITTDEEEIKNVGTYQIQVVGQGGFKGSWNLEFIVTPRDLAAHTEANLEKEDMPYNGGNEVKPSVVVTECGEGALLDDSNKPVQLDEGTDYVVSYENNKKSASGSDPNESNKPTVIITGKGNYSGTITKNFNIGTSIEKADVSLDVPAEGYTYDGKEHKPDLGSVYLGRVELIPGTDYELIPEPDADFTDAGEKHIKVKGKGAYYGTAVGTYTIKKSPETGKIKIELGELDYNKETQTYFATYTGSAIVPTVTVYDEAISKLTPLEDDDYTVSVLENVDAGKAFVYVDISKNYTGEDKQRMTFEILPRDISKDFNLILNKNNYEYEDSAIIPDISVVSKSGISPSVELEESDEYTISSLSNNVNAGIAKVTVVGVRNYTGTLSGEFMISAALDDPKSDFTSIEITKQFYMGEEVTPDVKIHCGGNDLVQEVDFHVENKWSQSDPYRGTAIITSKKPYYTCKEPIVMEYTLAYGAEYLKVTGFANEYTYTRSEIKPSFKITDLYGKEMDAKKLHYDPRKITYKNLETGKADCTNVGRIEATIPVSVDGQDEILLRAVYRIIPKNINDCSITKVNKNTYNGTAIEPAVAIVYNGHELTKNREFAESYANNINPGTATVVLQGQGNYTGQCSMHFKVEPAGMVQLKAKPESQSSIRIGWAKNAKVTGYEIYSENGKKKYGTTSKDYFVVKKLKPATKYTFKVRSYVKVNGVKTCGEAKKVTAYTEVPKVSVTVKSKKPGTATLKWKKQTSVDGYQVYRSTKSNGKYKKIASVPKKYDSYTDKKVKSKKTYYYKVRAYKRINGKYSYGDFSKKIKVKIK